MFVVIDEQEEFLVISKPHGVSFHNEGSELGLINLVREKLKIKNLYSVHRLDKVTSGLLLFAKTKDAARHFQKLFLVHQIEKKYIALSGERPKKKQGRVSGDMQKSRRGGWKLLRSKKSPAITSFKSYFLEESGLRLFVLSPKTGKTHQLRVMMKSLGSPILGDTLYAGRKEQRCFLHACSLHFKFEKEYNYTNFPSWNALEKSKICLDDLLLD